MLCLVLGDVVLEGVAVSDLQLLEKIKLLHQSDDGCSVSATRAGSEGADSGSVVVVEAFTES